MDDNEVDVDIVYCKIMMGVFFQIPFVFKEYLFTVPGRSEECIGLYKAKVAKIFMSLLYSSLLKSRSRPRSKMTPYCLGLLESLI